MSWSKLRTGWNSRANHDNNLLTTSTLDVLNDSINSDLGKDTFRLILLIITELFTEKLAQFFDCEGNRVRNWREMISYSQRGSSWSSSSSSCSSPLDADGLISSCYEQRSPYNYFNMYFQNLRVENVQKWTWWDFKGRRNCCCWWSGGIISALSHLRRTFDT